MKLGCALRSFSQHKLLNRIPATMERCFFRYERGEDRFQITFLFNDDDNKINRQFNFSRSTTENVDTLLGRITTNVEKILNKKKKKRKVDEPAENQPSIDVDLFENDIQVDRTLSCSELLNKSNLKLKIHDKVYDIVVNVPWVASISLPNSILSGFPVYPVNLQLQFAAKEKSDYNWFSGVCEKAGGTAIASEHIKWNSVGSGYTYTPSTRDIGLKLKVECIPSNGEITGPPVEAVSPVVVEAGPGKCPFEDRHAFTQNLLSGKSFRVVSYNILADLYCDSDYTKEVLHPYCPAYALHIDYRKQLIIKELLGYYSDIICLQEVDRKVFNHELVPVLEAVRMEGEFARKGKEVAEGVACFWRKDRFSLISSESLVLAEQLPTLECFQQLWNSIKDNKPLIERVLDRSTVVQGVTLQSVDNENEIVIAGNTHLYFHPDADHIRLLQGGLVIQWLNYILDRTKKEHPSKRVSLILCGDFNSVPSCGVYKLFTEGIAPETLPDWSSNEAEAVKGVTLQQPTALQSACGTPPFTNFTAGFADCLDYIFYSTNSLVVEQVVPLPSEEELRQHTALPSVVFPSDHISIAADLAFK